MSPFVNTMQRDRLVYRTLSEMVHRFIESLFQEILPPPSLNILYLIPPPKHRHSSLRPRITAKCFLPRPLPCRSPHKLLTFLRAHFCLLLSFHPSCPYLWWVRTTLKTTVWKKGLGRCQVYPEASLSAPVGRAGAVGPRY